MPFKPAMMAAWLVKAKEGESGTVIPSSSALKAQHNEAVKSICMPSSSSASEGVADWDLSEEEEEEAETVEGEEGEEEEKEEAESAVHERKVGVKSPRRSGVCGVGGEEEPGSQEGSKRRRKTILCGVAVEGGREEGGKETNLNTDTV